MVIELNRFNSGTGSSLFDWQRDIKILTGQSDLEFRIVTEHMYDKVDYNNVVFDDLSQIKKHVKKIVVQNNKTFIEKWLTWRN